LARFFRYYEKKRGNRRTGSPIWGRIGEAAGFAVLLVAGCVWTIYMLTDVVLPDWRANHEFVETTCKVLNKKIGEKDYREDGILYRPEFQIEYEADGGHYCDWRYNIDWHFNERKSYSSGRENAQAVLDCFEIYSPEKDNCYPCWYDPTNPRIVVLIRDIRWLAWLVFTVPVSFVIIGAGGLIYTLLHWGKSAEHRSAIRRRVSERVPFRRDDSRFPSVPRGADMTNSPGTKLKYRLPMARSPGWALFGTLTFSVLWNGIVVVFVVLAFQGILRTEPVWLLPVLFIPFASIGVGAIVVLFRKMLATAGIGPTLVEISDHPLVPGGQYRAFLSQSGRLTVNSLRISLVCEESATYRQGTNTRTEDREVSRLELFHREGIEIQRGLPLEIDFALSLPEQAMHSFSADHNEVNWTLVVDAELAGWPPYKRAFPVIVRPSDGAQKP
jgi:hypothetical protein